MTMWNKHSSCTIFSIVWILGTCYGFVLLSSAAKEYDEEYTKSLFVPGDEMIFSYNSSVSMNDDGAHSKNIGFSINGRVKIESIFEQSSHKILKITLDNPKLYIISRKNSNLDGFVYHQSKLNELLNKPFYIQWNSGKVFKLFVNAKEDTPLVNIKKSIASLLQIQIHEDEETDISGICSVKYEHGKQTISKSKTNCKSPVLKGRKNPEIALSVLVNSSQNILYQLPKIQRVHSEEKHVIKVASNEDFGFCMNSIVTLELIEQNVGKSSILDGNSIEETLDKLMEDEKLREETLWMEIEKSESSSDFSKCVEEHRDQLNSEFLGSASSAKAFVKLVTKSRNANSNELHKVLNSKKNVEILPQLFDILGATPTMASYKAAMSKLDYSKSDLYERYLWALSLDAHPNPKILQNIFEKFKKSNKDIPDKLKETMLGTIASMCYRLTRIFNENQLKEEITNFFLENLNAGNSGSDLYLRNIRNLKSPKTIPKLLEIIERGTVKEGVLAWRALEVINPKDITKKMLEIARKTFLQLDKKHDSSSRTIALKIITSADSFSYENMKEIAQYLTLNDTLYEVKQFAFQTLKMMAKDSEEFHRNLTGILDEDLKIRNNYNLMNPRGLSTAIKRTFVNNRSGKGSLVSLQEIHNAIVKRGVVNVVWEKNGSTSELFSLGIFTSGLNHFISSDSEENDEEVATMAGLELAVLGTQLRPFVFFTGQGELMGHVWSGTASEKTPAFQALIMLQDHLEYLSLSSGFNVELDVKGAVSLDLAGKVAISLWGRSAESLVEKNAGIYLTGSMKIDTSVVKSQVEFNAQLEPQLKLESDVDFSSGIKFCSRLSQEDVQLKHNVYKIERIPGSKHKLRIANYRKSSNPGITYSLNRKNNEMCSAVHNT